MFCYFVSKIVLTFFQEEIVTVIEKTFLKFEAEGREFEKQLRSLEQFIQASKINFRNRMFVLTYSWSFHRFNTLEQLEFKLEKNSWNLETYIKSKKIRYLHLL